MPRGPTEPLRRGMKAAGRWTAAPAQARARLAGAVRDRPGLHRRVDLLRRRPRRRERARAHVVVFLAGAVFFAVLVTSYVEGASLHQERGGATVIARYAFNELWSFVAGWAILLDYLILIALTAFATTDYAAVFFEPFEAGVPEFLLGGGDRGRRGVVNVRGSSPRRFERAGADRARRPRAAAAGGRLRPGAGLPARGPHRPGGDRGAPSLEDMVFAFPLVLVAFSGIDASSGPRRAGGDRPPRAAPADRGAADRRLRALRRHRARGLRGAADAARQRTGSRRR